MDSKGGDSCYSSQDSSFQRTCAKNKFASSDMITSIEQGQQPGENYSAAGISLHLFQVSAPFFYYKKANI
jgi:hypothetical protein